MIFYLPILLHNEVQMLIKILRKQLRAELELGPSLFLLSRLVSRAGRGQSGRSATRRITLDTGHRSHFYTDHTTFTSTLTRHKCPVHNSALQQGCKSVSPCLV